MKRFLLICLTTLFCFTTWAFNFEVDGIYYNILDNTTAEVTWGGSSSSSGTEAYVGNIIIPEKVSYENCDYIVISIGDYAFAYCSSLTGIDIPSSVTSIGNRAFAYCYAMEGIDIPDNVTSIDPFAFTYCTALKKVVLSNNLTFLNNCLFEGCTSLEEINIPEGVTEFGNYLFENCKSLPSINIPSAVRAIGVYAFYGCSLFTELTIPEGVTSLEMAIFDYCTSLEKITLPETLTSIGWAAFEYCESLEELTIPNKVTSISGTAFNGCHNLKNLILGSRVSSIGDKAFYNCNELSSLTSLNPTPPSVVNYLTDIPTEKCVLKVPTQSIDTYKEDSKWGIFESIEGVGYTLSVETLDATNVLGTSATLNATITNYNSDSILEQGFEYYTSSSETTKLVGSGDDMSIKLSNLSKNTKYTYFAYATTEKGTTYGQEMSFTTKVYDFDVDDIYYNISSDGSDTDLTVEVTYASTSYNSYSGNISIPEAVTYDEVNYSVASIGESAFRNSTALTEVSIPTSVNSIENYAFNGCSSLMQVNSYNTTPPTCGNSVFAGIDDECVLYVPTRALDDYRNANTWKDFYRILGFNEPYVATLSATDITIDSAIINGSITENSDSVIEKGFEWWLDADNVNTIVVANATADEISAYIGGLAKNTSYTYHAYATTENGTYYGDDVVFSTANWDCDFYVGDVYYNYGIEEATCEVTYRDEGYNSYSGVVNVPEKATYHNVEYTIVGVGERAFQESTELIEVTLPTTVTYISTWSFYNCSSLSEIIIPDAVTEIGNQAFNGCESLVSVTIGARVESIGNNSFNCSNLEEIYSLNPEPPTCNIYAFRSVNTSTCKLYVPSGTKEVYSSADVWRDFYNVDEIDGTGISALSANGTEIESYYSTSGQKFNTPQRGVNIVHFSDGTSKKIMIK